MTMSDLIRREEAIDAMITLGIKRAVPIFVTLPSVESERKKGECTKINCPIQMNYISNNCDIKTCPYRTERQIGKWKNVALFTRECSECGAQIHELEYDNFCPNCGADMRGEK